ncbi:MAG: M23 family metallopeptidase [Candidatus Binatia bacterium]
MLDRRVWSRILRGARLSSMIAGVVLVVGVPVTVSTVERLRAQTREIRWLRARLSEKRELVEQQRSEMGRVAGAVDRVAWQVAGVRERAAQIRRLAQMKESGEATRISADVIAESSEDRLSGQTARVLEQLARLEGHAQSVGDSMAVLTTLLQERVTHGVATAPTAWPVRGNVTSDFGPRQSPYGIGSEMHPGVDIQAPYGTPVGASGAGEVIFTGYDPGYGQMVIVAHGKDLATLYGHLSATYVREGVKVRRGDVLGAVGASGRVTGTHLHFEVRANGQPVDPQRFLHGSSGVQLVNASVRLTTGGSAAIENAARRSSSRLVGP